MTEAGDDAAGGKPADRRNLRDRSAAAAAKAELQAKAAEAEWLKSHYDEQLRAAFAQIAALQARLRTADAAPAPAPRVNAPDPAEIVRLRAEVERLTEAEARYLDRIAELKEALLRGRLGGDPQK